MKCRYDISQKKICINNVFLFACYFKLYMHFFSCTLFKTMSLPIPSLPPQLPKCNIRLLKKKKKGERERQIALDHQYLSGVVQPRPLLIFFYNLLIPSFYTFLSFSRLSPPLTLISFLSRSLPLSPASSLILSLPHLALASFLLTAALSSNYSVCLISLSV